MVGRGAMGNPFLFEQINDYLNTGTYREYLPKHKLDVFCRYLAYANDYKIKFANIKQQAMRFTKGFVDGTKLRPKIMIAKTIDELKNTMIQAL
jgi:tRNA-dihydrouridine synthase